MGKVQRKLKAALDERQAAHVQAKGTHKPGSQNRKKGFGGKRAKR